MVRGRSSSGRSSSGGGPGLFGGLGLGVVSQCDNEMTLPFVNLVDLCRLSQIFTLFFFIYLVYMFVKPYLGKRKRR